FASAEAEPTKLGELPMRRRQRWLKRNLPGPFGLAGRGASAALRGLAVVPTTASAARLASAPSPSQRGSRRILRQAPSMSLPSRWARFRSQAGRIGFGVFADDRIVEYEGDLFDSP